MKSMHQALNEWWSHWASSIPVQDGDALPSDVEMEQLETILQNIVEWAFCLKAELGQTAESSFVPGAGGSLARESQSEESSVPATVSLPTLPLTHDTMMVDQEKNRHGVHHSLI